MGKRGEMDIYWSDLRGQFQDRDLQDVSDYELALLIGYTVERGPGNPNLKLIIFLGRGNERVLYEVEETE